MTHPSSRLHPFLLLYLASLCVIHPTSPTQVLCHRHALNNPNSPALSTGTFSNDPAFRPPFTSRWSNHRLYLPSALPAATSVTSVDSPSASSTDKDDKKLLLEVKDLTAVIAKSDEKILNGVNISVCEGEVILVGNEIPDQLLEGNDHETESSGEVVSEEEIQADFAFFDPKPDDFHGVKTLLQAYLDDKQWDLSSFVDLILAQTSVGTVVKLEDDEDNGSFAIATALNFGRHKKKTQRREVLTDNNEDDIIYVKVEDELLHKLCSWCFTFPMHSQQPADQELKKLLAEWMSDGNRSWENCKIQEAAAITN